MKRHWLSLFCFFFLASYQINSVPHPNTKPPSTLHNREKLLLHVEHHSAISHLLQLPGGPYRPRHRPSYTRKLTHTLIHIDKWTVEGQVSKAIATRRERGAAMIINTVHWDAVLDWCKCSLTWTRRDRKKQNVRPD